MRRMTAPLYTVRMFDITEIMQLKINLFPYAGIQKYLKTIESPFQFKEYINLYNCEVFFCNYSYLILCKC